MSFLKKCIFTTSTALTLLSIYSAQAGYMPENVAPPPVVSNSYQWYVNGTGGVSFFSNTRLDGIRTTYSGGWNLGFAAGLRYQPFRFELEYRFQQSDLNEADAIPF